MVGRWWVLFGDGILRWFELFGRDFHPIVLLGKMRDMWRQISHQVYRLKDVSPNSAPEIFFSGLFTLVISKINGSWEPLKTYHDIINHNHIYITSHEKWEDRSYVFGFPWGLACGDTGGTRWWCDSLDLGRSLDSTERLEKSVCWRQKGMSKSYWTSCLNNMLE